MSIDVSGVGGQGSIHQAQQQKTQTQQAERPVRQDSSSDLAAAIEAETQRKQVISRLERSEEQAAARQATREELEAEVERAMEQLKQANLPFNHKLQYRLNFEEQQIVVRVLDRSTDELIKELPPVAIQRLHQRIQEFIGLMVDEQV